MIIKRLGNAAMWFKMFHPSVASLDLRGIRHNKASLGLILYFIHIQVYWPTDVLVGSHKFRSS